MWRRASWRLQVHVHRMLNIPAVSLIAVVAMKARHTAITAMLCFCNKISQHQNMSRGFAESRAQAAQHFAAAVSEYGAALRRPEALGGLADRNSVRYNFVCACVLAAGAAAGADAGSLQARSYVHVDMLMAWL